MEVLLLIAWDYRELAQMRANGTEPKWVPLSLYAELMFPDVPPGQALWLERNRRADLGEQRSAANHLVDLSTGELE